MLSLTCGLCSGLHRVHAHGSNLSSHMCVLPAMAGFLMPWTAILLVPQLQAGSLPRVCKVSKLETAVFRCNPSCVLQAWSTRLCVGDFPSEEFVLMTCATVQG